VIAAELIDATTVERVSEAPIETAVPLMVRVEPQPPGAEYVEPVIEEMCSALSTVADVCCAWLAVDWADSTSLVIEVMPSLAA